MGGKRTSARLQHVLTWIKSTVSIQPGGEVFYFPLNEEVFITCTCSCSILTCINTRLLVVLFLCQINVNSALWGLFQPALCSPHCSFDCLNVVQLWSECSFQLKTLKPSCVETKLVSRCFPQCLLPTSVMIGARSEEVKLTVRLRFIIDAFCWSGDPMVVNTQRTGNIQINPLNSTCCSLFWNKSCGGNALLCNRTTKPFFKK